uniref:Uncharacterized protein n=1 Tax=Sus scrofa TaxID=9823 RepID=A0A4X1UWF2_PIG
MVIQVPILQPLSPPKLFQPKPTGFSRRQVRSTTDTLGVGTRKAMPVSFLGTRGSKQSQHHPCWCPRHPGQESSKEPHPLSSGMTLPTALAAPVEAGMMFWAAPRPSRHSFPDGPSTVFWVAVMAWTVVWRQGGGVKALPSACDASSLWEELRDTVLGTTPPHPSSDVLSLYSSGLSSGRGRIQSWVRTERALAQSPSPTMSPSTMPKWSWMTLARGAKQLVVQEALLKRGRQVNGQVHGVPRSMTPPPPPPPSSPDDLEGVVILLMVHAHHKHGGIGRRGRDDDPLGPTLQVSLQQRSSQTPGLPLSWSKSASPSLPATPTPRLGPLLFRFPAAHPGLLHGREDTSGLHNIRSTSIAPFDVGGISPRREDRTKFRGAGDHRPKVVTPSQHHLLQGKALPVPSSILTPGRW